MEPQLEQIREQQKLTWNKFSSGWKKWDDHTMNWLKPMGDEIIRSLGLKETDNVLDVAAGTGEPGLTIATLVKNGRVVITDLAEDMLNIARENATNKGIVNCELVACDVCEMPFEDDSFDAISCRFGFMFFPDMLMAAKEMRRVLKPGGKMATSVWGPADQNFWVTAIMGTINKNMQLPSPPPGAPGMFRCAAPGLIAGLLKEAGFQEITEKEIRGTLNCGSSENYWNFMNDVAAPIVSAMSKADEDMKDKIRKEVLGLVNSKNDAALEYGAIVVSGVK